MLRMLHFGRWGMSGSLSLALVIGAGVTMQAGWLSLWSVSHAARVMANVTVPWSADAANLGAWLMGRVVTAVRRSPRTGPLGGLNVAASLAVATISPPSSPVSGKR